MDEKDKALLERLLLQAWEDFVLQTDRKDSFVNMDVWLKVTAKGVCEIDFDYLKEI